MGDNKDLGERLKQGADDLVLWLAFAIAWFCFIAVFNWFGLFLGWFPAMLIAIVISELWAQQLTVVLVVLFWLAVAVAFFLHQCTGYLD
jgi:hypothetical protein